MFYMPRDSECVRAAPQLRSCFLFRYLVFCTTLRLLCSLLNNNNYSQGVFKAGEVPPSLSRRATTYKKLAGHALFVVLIAISLFPVYFGNNEIAMSTTKRACPASFL